MPVTNLAGWRRRRQRPKGDAVAPLHVIPTDVYAGLACRSRGGITVGPSRPYAKDFSGQHFMGGRGTATNEPTTQTYPWRSHHTRRCGLTAGIPWQKRVNCRNGRGEAPNFQRFGNNSFSILPSFALVLLRICAKNNLSLYQHFSFPSVSWHDGTRTVPLAYVAFALKQHSALQQHSLYVL